MHLYCVIQGRYKTAITSMANEMAQTGFRICVNTASSFEPIGTLPADDEVYPVATTHSRDETDWTITGNWNLEMGVTDLDPADYLNDQIAPAVVALMGRNVSSLPPFSSNYYVETIKLYPIANNGSVAPAAPFAVGTPCALTFKTQTACDGAGAAQFIPPQLTPVASLRTNQLGGGGRGRMFLPGFSNAMYGGDGLTAAGVTTQIATGVAEMLGGVRLDFGTGGVNAVPIVAATYAVSPSQRNYGPYAEIVTVRVGNVLDTQRRRRRQMVETYASVNV